MANRCGLLALAVISWIWGSAAPGDSSWALRASDVTATRLKARAVSALGGAGPLERTHAIWVRGRHETSVLEVDSAGTFDVAARRPDAVRLVEGFDWTTNLAVRTANGSAFWVGDIRKGAYRPQRAILDDAARRESGHRTLTAEATRFLVVWLVNAPRSVGAVASDAGKWTIGREAFESLWITGANDFRVRLGFDPATGLPARLGYSTSRPRRSTDKASPGGIPVSVVWELGDHRTVNGIRFAHQIVMRMDGAVFRRIQVQEVKLDPEVPADFFNPGSR